MHLDPRRLLVLLSVHRAGGVTAAGEEAHMTASAVSQQIARLEQEIGLPVLDRRPRGVVLTPAGRLLVETAERLESELTEARLALEALGSELGGTVVVGGFRTVIRGLLLPLVAVLAERLPGVRLDIREIDAGLGLDALRGGELDVLLLEADTPVGQRAPRGTTDLTILDEPWLVALPATAAPPASLADLAHLPWLSVDPDDAAHHATERILRTYADPQRVGHRYRNYDVALSMVAAGLGVALLPALAVWPGSPEGVQIVRLPGSGTRRVIARHRSTRTEPRAEVRETVHLLQELTAGYAETAALSEAQR